MKNEHYGPLFAGRGEGGRFDEEDTESVALARGLPGMKLFISIDTEKNLTNRGVLTVSMLQGESRKIGVKASARRRPQNFKRAHFDKRLETR